MRKHYLLFLSVLAPAFLVLGGYAALKAQQTPTSTAVKAGRWSDAATWADKKVPGKDAAVTIDRNVNVVLDVTPPALHSLTINGELSKLAWNITTGHGIHAGIHFRSSSYWSILLGEQVGLSILQDCAAGYNEPFTIHITKFDGTTATISNQSH